MPNSSHVKESGVAQWSKFTYTKCASLWKSDRKSGISVLGLWFDHLNLIQRS